MKGWNPTYRLWMRILVSAFAYSVVYHLIWENDQSFLGLRAAQVIGVAVFVLEVCRLQIQERLGFYTARTRVAFWITTISTGSYCIVQVHYGSLYFLGLAYPLAFVGLAIAILEHGLSRPSLWGLFYAVVAHFAIGYYEGHAMRDLVRGSENHVSTVVLFVALLLYTTDSLQDRKISVLPALFSFLCCMLAKGRGGILSSGVLLAGIVMLRLFHNRGPVVIGLLFAGSVLSLASSSRTYLIGWIHDGLVKFQEQGFEASGREMIASYYMENIDPESFFFGLPVEQALFDLDLTLHNSFLSIHSAYGVGLLGILALTGYAFAVKVRYSTYQALFLLVALVRGATDSVLYVGSPTLGLPFVLILASCSEVYGGRILGWRRQAGVGCRPIAGGKSRQYDVAALDTRKVFRPGECSGTLASHRQMISR